MPDSLRKRFTSQQLQYLDEANSTSYTSFDLNERCLLIQFVLWPCTDVAFYLLFVCVQLRQFFFHFQDMFLHKVVFSWLYNLPYFSVSADAGVSVTHPSQLSEQMCRTERPAAERAESQAVSRLMWEKSVVWNVMWMWSGRSRSFYCANQRLACGFHIQTLKREVVSWNRK